MNILNKIVLYKKEVVGKDKQRLPLEILKEQVSHQPEKFSRFYDSIEKHQGTYLICEVKKASPSCPEGFLKDFDHIKIAQEYIQNNVPTISVLTDEKYFQGSNGILRKVRSLTKDGLILRKEFIIDEYQIYEAKVMGADLILLIAAILTENELEKFYDLAQSLGLGVLVEVHDEEEVNKVRGFQPTVMGVNNRNLKDFSIDINQTVKLREVIDFSCKLISESGIVTREDILHLEANGADGFLIGTALVKSGDITGKLRELMQ